jgi:response regulator RpfG family c-di-GMP phosphodiesterase
MNEPSAPGLFSALRRKHQAAGTVTVVEDEPLAQDVLIRAARAWNFECQAASNAEQAVMLLERQPTQIVVTDLRMPGRGGVWLVREIQRRWPGTGVIVITAGDENDAAIQCLEAGADHYFLKPIKLDEFRHALEATLRAHRVRGQRERLRRRLERAVQKQTRRVRHTFLSAIESLVRAIEERDPYTAGHSMRVHRYALDLADALGLDPRLRKQLSLAAKLHDVGKVGVPEAVLNKPGPLNAEESAQVRQHPAIGERILSPIIRRPAILAGIRGHHERLDGKGYPDGLKGEQIPFLARLIAVPDCFDALTSSRAYRAALPVGHALELLRAGSGSQFDPDLVRVFIGVIQGSSRGDCPRVVSKN